MEARLPQVYRNDNYYLQNSWSTPSFFSDSPSCSFKSTNQGENIVPDAGNNAPEIHYDAFNITIINFLWVQGSVMVIEADAMLKFGHCHSSFPRGVWWMVDANCEVKNPI